MNARVFHRMSWLIYQPVSYKNHTMILGQTHTFSNSLSKSNAYEFKFYMSSSSCSPNSNHDSRVHNQTHKYGWYSSMNTKRVFGVTATLATVALCIHHREHIEIACTAATRNLYTSWTLAVIMLDYWQLIRSTKEQQQKVVCPADMDAVTDAINTEWSNMHLRSALRLRQLFRSNGGVYVKLGQHISALVYLLPKEYTETMKELQDKCDPSTWKEVDDLLQSEMDEQTMSIFDSIDHSPVGVASLAQVHQATLQQEALSYIPDSCPNSLIGMKTNQHESIKHVDLAEQPHCLHPHHAGNHSIRKAAIKVQHPSIEKFAEVDIRTCIFGVTVLEYFFPQFQLGWLARELERSLKLELDFRLEANNCNRIRNMFLNSGLISVPKVIWVSKRVLVMEYIDGAKIDDKEYMKKHNIHPEAVTQDLSRAFFEMMFYHGFVHCDPHPGNVFIRACKDRLPWYRFLVGSKPRNYQIVLLDHGLYQSLSKQFRLDYAHFWTALINGCEADIETYFGRFMKPQTSTSAKLELGTIRYHRLFASMVCGRSWGTIAFRPNSDVQKSSTVSTGSINNDAMTGSTLDLEERLVNTNLSSIEADQPNQQKRAYGLARSRSVSEIKQIQHNAQSAHFLAIITDILGQLSPQLLFVLKTQDILRSIDKRLEVSHGSHHVARMVAIVGEYCAEVIRNDDIERLKSTRYIDQGGWNRIVWPIWTFTEFWKCWKNYVETLMRLTLLYLVT
ncbi:hypothetical protein BDEG_28035 [Batrachochytrium dendrobatidis JEL423]|uniref:ABC1 atypical kinase-like domain-containing protein n=1 Tax=Batrachochytrium dendrobatidis (strain JEL423) TaxID=403673 RepID=A0A177WXN4_BATDL|nr:hypothetical protein BDEG_28035 [Batrachochytrium dendrobatidis JEL423]